MAAISIYVNWMCVYVRTDLTVHVGSGSFGNTHTQVKLHRVHVMKTYGQVTVWLLSFITLTVDGNKWSVLGIGRFTPGKEPAVEAIRNVMAHAQKIYVVFRRNGRVHLNQRGRQFSRLLAAEVCASAVVMLDTPCSEVV